MSHHLNSMKIFMLLCTFFSVIRANEMDWDNFKNFTEFHASFIASGGGNYTMNVTKGRDLWAEKYVPTADKELPSEVDWRKKGAVTPARKQGGCGSCWAFTATSAIESHYLKNGRNISFLSPQNLIDCTMEYGNVGCAGGFRDQGFRYIIENGGINTEETYPYEEKEGPCRYNASDIGATLTGFVSVPDGNYQALKDVLANIGPVGAVFDASMETLQFYSSGVYHDPTCRSGIYDLNHDVLVIGYGTENGTDFWIIKNSWGETWGENGFLKISTATNSCGLASYASYPLITDSGEEINLELLVIIYCFLFITVSK
ncbi:procathepsin L isoform X2 [Anabrus simplex]|uniref:procathepsin L isoform X2 n=1 Tax=Anabrus simplex TaxID=316456 RepID=UPI0034DD3CD7